MPDLSEESEESEKTVRTYAMLLVRWARREQNRYRRFFSSQKRGIESNRVRRFDKIPCAELADLLNTKHAMTVWRLGHRVKEEGALAIIKRLAGVHKQPRKDVHTCPKCGSVITDTGNMDTCPECGDNLTLAALFGDIRGENGRRVAAD